MTAGLPPAATSFLRQFFWWLPRWAILVSPVLGIAAAADLNDPGGFDIFPASFLAMLIYLLVVPLALSLHPALADPDHPLGRAIRTGIRVRLYLPAIGLCFLLLGRLPMSLTLPEIGLAESILEVAGKFNRHLPIDVFSLMNLGVANKWPEFTTAFVIFSLFAAMQILVILLLSFPAALLNQAKQRKRFFKEAPPPAKSVKTAI